MNLKIGENLSWEKIEDELVIFKLDTGSYYRLNKTGGFVFSRLSSGMSISKIIEDMDKLYDKDIDTMTSDTNSFIQELISEGLLTKDE